MKTATTKSNRIVRSLPDRCLPAIVAVGSSLATIPAAALELGELTVQSRLGQPLRASIAYALAPTEQISSNCVTMRPGPSLSGLPASGVTSINVTNGVILLAGSTPVREPMISAHVIVNCPYAANLSREYMLFIDPASSDDRTIYQDTVVTRQSSRVAEPVVVAPAAIERPVASVQKAPVVRDIETSTRYQVQRGETLSGIVSRIKNRSMGLWPAVNVIFEANPNAFTRNDPNNLKAGSWLEIPSFDGNAAIVSDAESVSVDTSAGAETVTADLEPTELVVEESTVEIYEPAIVIEAAPSEEVLVVDETQVEAVEESASAVVLDDLTNSNLTVVETQPSNIILDTELPGPTTTSQSPNGTTAVITAKQPVDDNGSSSSWIAWLAGSVVAIAFALMMARRRLRVQPDPHPDARYEDEEDQYYQSDTQSTDASNTEAAQDDPEISDDSPTDENLILNADVVTETGLASNSAADISPSVDATSTTQASPVLTPTEEHAILESEVLPHAKQNDYKSTASSETTQLPQIEDVDDQGSETVEVPTYVDTVMTPTLNRDSEADFQVLEQDYEDEMTATQALNQEIADAAAELTAQMEIEALGPSDGNTGDETTMLPLATVTELGATAQIKRDSTLDETGIDETISTETISNDETAEIPIGKGKAS